MEISREKTGDLLVVRLNGRLDANWCNHVQSALATAVRDGEHRVHLDMADVGYVSSAGLRVLLSFYKQLKSINGQFGVARPSEAVRSVLELAGLDLLIAADTAGKPASAAAGRPHESASATYEIFSAPGAAATGRISARPIGDPALLRNGANGTQVPRAAFAGDTIALGIGALGPSYDDCVPRFGEFLAVGGAAAFQPSDGSSRPDFVVSEGALVPEGFLLLGLSGTGNLPTLARFEARKERRTVPLAELAQTALELSGAPAAAFVAITETAGLVGATLRQSPARASAGDARFAFPQIRDWLSFTSERAFRDSTSILVGAVARPGTTFDRVLRPLGPKSPLLAHVHAAVFPYRPLRKGAIELTPSVRELFDGHALQSVLHLLADPREFNGAGDSEFFRGALWLAPLQST